MKKIFVFLFLLLGSIIYAQSPTFTVYNSTTTPALTTNSFKQVVVGKSGQVWFGGATGLFTLTGTTWQSVASFSNYAIHGMNINAKDSSVWIAHSGSGGVNATMGGIDYFPGTDINIHTHWSNLYYPGPVKSLPSRYAYSVAILNGKIWAACSEDLTGSTTDEGGIGYLSNPANNEFSRITTGLPATMILCYAVGIQKTANPEVWIGVDASPGTSAYMARYDTSNNYLGKFDGTNTSLPLATPRPKAIYCAKDGTCWVGFNTGIIGVYSAGLFSILNSSNSLMPASATTNYNAISEDLAGNIWIGTNSGLLEVDNGNFISNAAFHFYTTADGLPSNNITGIASDKNNNKWICTDAGIAYMTESFKIALQPESKKKYYDSTAIFKVMVSGSGTMSYQWQKDTKDIPNATTNILKFSKLEYNDSAIYKCRIVHGLNAEDTLFTNDAELKVINYDLKFRTIPNGWSFPNDANVYIPTDWNSTYNDNEKCECKDNTGAVTNPKGLAFPTWNLFTESYGHSQCEYTILGEVFRKWSAEKKWDWLKGCWGGSCFGLAISSLIAYDFKAISIYKSNAPIPALFSLSLNPDTRNCINRLFFFQFAKDNWTYMQTQKGITTPNETLQEIKKMLASTTRDDKIIVFFNQHGSGGHAVTPYMVKRDPLKDSVEYIYVYDNNFPGDATIRFKIRTDLNKWSYRAAVNVGAFMSDWGGYYGMILMNPVSQYNGTPPTMLKGLPPKKDWILKSSGNSKIEVYNSWTNPISINNRNDSIIYNYPDSNLINNIPSAIPLIPVTGRNHPPIGYSLPDDNYNVKMKLVGKESHLTILKDTIGLSYEHTDGQPGQSDEVSFDNNSIFIHNYDGQTKKVKVEAEMSENSNQRDKIYTLSNFNVYGNDSIKFNMVAENLEVKNFGAASYYKLRLKNIANDDLQIFTHDSIPIPGNTIHTITPVWSNVENKDLYITEDIGMTGHISDTIRFSNYSNISGHLVYDNSRSSNLKIKNVKILISDLERLVKDSTLTDSLGRYNFNQIRNSSYVVSATYNGKYLTGGFNPMDALTVNRSFVLLYNFTDPLKQLAADVNKDGEVNPVDALLINRRFVKLDNSFPAGNWLFTHDTINVLKGNMTYDFKAICVGDANGSYIPLK